MTLAGRFSTLLCLACLGCQDQIGELPEELAPQPLVVLDVNADSKVRELTASVRVSLATLPTLPNAGAALPEPMKTLAFASPSFPLEVELPNELLTMGAAFWLEVSALDDAGRSLTTARLIAETLPERTLEPELWLRDACRDVICGVRSLTCSPEATCRSAIRAAEDLPSESWD